MSDQKECVDLFVGFQDYWSLTKNLTEHQRDTLISSLPIIQRNKLIKSYKEGGWEDLFMRNKLDKVLDEIKTDIGQDLLAIRCKIFSGGCHYMKKANWTYIKDRLLATAKNEKHLKYILSGIKVDLEDKDTVCLTHLKKV